MNEEIDLKKYIKNAPREIVDFLKEGVWSLVVQEIAKKNNFINERTIVLQNETLFVLLGMELKTSFTKNLERELKVPEILAKTIADEIVLVR